MDVVDVCSVVYSTEETLVAVFGTVVCLTDADAADGVVATVVGAVEVAETTVVASYGLVVLLVFVSLVGWVAEGDVGCLSEGFAVAVVSGVDG